MGFISLKPYQFRNLVFDEVSLDAKNICFIGENGQGKTNIIEAVYFLCFASSFRTRQERLLIQEGKHDLSVSGVFNADNLYSRKLLVKITNGKKEIRVDGNSIRDRKELITNIPCIVFAHNDIFFINGPPERKRWFFNQTLSLNEPVVIDLLREYKKILRARNIILKERNEGMLDVISTQLARTGAVLCTKRKNLIDEFNKTFTPLYQKISGLEDEIKIRYSPSWKNPFDPEGANKELETGRKTDMEYGITTTGPHRDNFSFRKGSADFSQLASTGQVRLISLVLKIAQAVFFSGKTGKKPVLLLDDVLLELDSKKREKFFESLPEYDQAFFTFLNGEDSRILSENGLLCYTVKEGGLYPWIRQETF